MTKLLLKNNGNRIAKTSQNLGNHKKKTFNQKRKENPRGYHLSRRKHRDRS